MLGIVIPIIIIAFSYGVAVGVYEYFPYEILDASKDVLVEQKTIQNNQFVNQADVGSLIKINNEVDIDQKRSLLTEFFWNVGSFHRVTYNTQPPEVEYDISDSNYSDFQNLKRIDRLTVEMDYGINSISYLFVPKQSNEKLILYHQGHGGDFILGKDTIQFFLDRNFTVIAMAMPLLGMNNQPIVEIDGLGEMKLTSHKKLRLLETDSFNPMKLFLDPIQINLNFLDKEYNFKRYSMIGLSGGGWTTVVYSAIDERISDSFSVGGSTPFYLRVDSRDMGDYEQTNIELYKHVNYLELYVLGAYGDNRRLVLFYNEFDPCCFSGELYNKFPFGDMVKTKLSKFNEGNFDVIIDYGQTKHMISENTLGKITEYIQNNS
mgnify:CR=1 FL=1